MSHASESTAPSLGHPTVETSFSEDASYNTSDPQVAMANRQHLMAGGSPWQLKLLPLMSGMLVALTAFFFIASFVQLYYLQTRIEKGAAFDLAPALRTSDDFEATLR